MSKLQFLKQWKSAGPHQPCCKFEDGKEGFTRRNKKLRHAVRIALHKYTHADALTKRGDK